MEKLQLLKEQQQETYQRQQALIKDMEEATKFNLIEKQKQAKEREEKKQDFKRQANILFRKFLTFFFFFIFLDINCTTRSSTI
jgi:hypothetical protein